MNMKTIYTSEFQRSFGHRALHRGATGEGRCKSSYSELKLGHPKVTLSQRHCVQFAVQSNFIQRKWSPRPLTSRIAASSEDHSSPPVTFSRQLAKLLVQKEEELKRLTAPGTLAPKAAVVTAMRKEIAVLRQQLKAAVAPDLPTLASQAPSTRTTKPSIPNTWFVPSPGTQVVTQSNTGPSTAFAALGGTARSAREALLLVERQLSSVNGQEDSSVLYGAALGLNASLDPELSGAVVRKSSEEAQLEALQQENAVLKARLEALLELQRRLKALQERKKGSTKQTKPNGSEESTAPKPRTRRRSKEKEDTGAEPKRRRKPKESVKEEGNLPLQSNGPLSPTAKALVQSIVA